MTDAPPRSLKTEALATLGTIAIVFPLVVYAAWAWSVCFHVTFRLLLNQMFPATAEPTTAQFVAVWATVRIFFPGTGGTSSASTRGDRVAGLLMPWVVCAISWLLAQVFTVTPYAAG